MLTNFVIIKVLPLFKLQKQKKQVAVELQILSKFYRLFDSMWSENVLSDVIKMTTLIVLLLGNSFAKALPFFNVVLPSPSK